MLKVEQRRLLPSPPLPPPQVLVLCLSLDLTFVFPSSFSATHFCSPLLSYSLFLLSSNVSNPSFLILLCLFLSPFTLSLTYSFLSSQIFVPPFISLHRLLSILSFLSHLVSFDPGFRSLSSYPLPFHLSTLLCHPHFYSACSFYPTIQHSCPSNLFYFLSSRAIPAITFPYFLSFLSSIQPPQFGLLLPQQQYANWVVDLWASPNASLLLLFFFLSASVLSLSLQTSSSKLIFTRI